MHQGFKVDANFKLKIPSLLCPDWHEQQDEDKELVMVENKYTNRTNQKSFSIEMVACSNLTGSCKGEDEIRKFLRSFYFTFYTVHERVEFKDDNLMKNPMSSKSNFHSQFMLDLDKYRDNNNFIRINDVTTNDNRYSFNSLGEMQYRHIDLIINQPWEGPSEVWTINATRDHGKTYK